jgi:hypothetical protein
MAGDKKFRFKPAINESSKKTKIGMEWPVMVEEMKNIGYDYTGDYSFTPKGYSRKYTLYRFDWNSGNGQKNLKKPSLKELKEKFKGRATIHLSGSEYAPEQTKIMMTNRLFETDDKQIKESEEGEKSYNYRLLSRLQHDCDYFLGAGGRQVKHLWAGNVTDQIAKMKELYNGFADDKKPEWISMEKIEEYEAKMNDNDATKKQIGEAEDHADIVVKICTCNDAFSDNNRQAELSKIFRDIVRKIDNGFGANFKIKDTNGNVIGSITDSAEPVNEAIERHYPEIEKMLSAEGKKIADIAKIYSGKDRFCRCGCGGKYFEAADKGIDRVYGNLEKILATKAYTEISWEGEYVNISMEQNKAYTIYFE